MPWPSPAQNNQALYNPLPLADFDFSAGTYVESGVSSALADAAGWAFSRSGARYTNDPAQGLFATNVPRIVSGSGALFSVGVTNQARASTDFSDVTVWTVGTGGSISGTPVVGPTGTALAQAFTWPSDPGSSFGLLTQHWSGNAAVALTFSIWAKLPSGSKTMRLQITDYTMATSYSPEKTVTTAWTRFDYAMPAATLSNTGNLGIGLWNGITGSLAPGDTVYLWGPQLEAGASATAYAPNTSTSNAVTVADDSAVLTRAGAVKSNVTVGGVTTVAGTATPLNLGVTGGGSWLGSFIQRVVVR